jgi:hypothetical protein
MICPPLTRLGASQSVAGSIARVSADPRTLNLRRATTVRTISAKRETRHTVPRRRAGHRVTIGLPRAPLPPWIRAARLSSSSATGTVYQEWGEKAKRGAEVLNLPACNHPGSNVPVGNGSSMDAFVLPHLATWLQASPLPPLQRSAQQLPHKQASGPAMREVPCCSSIDSAFYSTQHHDCGTASIATHCSCCGAMPHRRHTLNRSTLQSFNCSIAPPPAGATWARWKLNSAIAHRPASFLPSFQQQYNDTTVSIIPPPKGGVPIFKE